MYAMKSFVVGLAYTKKRPCSVVAMMTYTKKEAAKPFVCKMYHPVPPKTPTLRKQTSVRKQNIQCRAGLLLYVIVATVVARAYTKK